VKNITCVVAFFALFGISCVAFAVQLSAFQYYYKGEYTKAHPKLLKLAEGNNLQAQYFLAKMNLFGYGMKKNRENGFKYMRDAANSQNLHAQIYLGAYYLNQKKDIKEALIWLNKAADQGNAKAQMFTALSYFLQCRQEFRKRKRIHIKHIYLSNRKRRRGKMYSQQ
jgi:enhanced entry protein EnhC